MDAWTEKVFTVEKNKKFNTDCETKKPFFYWTVRPVSYSLTSTNRRRTQIFHQPDLPWSQFQQIAVVFHHHHHEPYWNQLKSTPWGNKFYPPLVKVVTKMPKNAWQKPRKLENVQRSVQEPCMLESLRKRTRVKIPTKVFDPTQRAIGLVSCKMQGVLRGDWTPRKSSWRLDAPRPHRETLQLVPFQRMSRWSRFMTQETLACLLSPSWQDPMDHSLAPFPTASPKVPTCLSQIQGLPSGTPQHPKCPWGDNLIDT